MKSSFTFVSFFLSVIPSSLVRRMSYSTMSLAAFLPLPKYLLGTSYLFLFRTSPPIDRPSKPEIFLTGNDGYEIVEKSDSDIERYFI